MMKKMRKATGFVRWYNPERGFGHVRIEDGPDMALLKADVLAKAGFVTAPDGAKITCDVAQGDHSPVVTRVVELNAAAEPAARNAPEGETPERAVVSRFSAARGDGTLKVQESGETVDISTPTLRRCGFIRLEKGAEVQVVAQKKSGVKRRQAVWIRAHDAKS